LYTFATISKVIIPIKLTTKNCPNGQVKKIQSDNISWVFFLPHFRSKSKNSYLCWTN